MRGKWIVGLLLALGLLAAAVAWWNGFQRGRRVLGLWGAPTAELVRIRSTVEVARLERSTEPAESPAEPEREVEIGGSRWRIVARHDATNARGLVHARQAIIDDPSYDWDRPAPTAGPDVTWRYLITFRREDRSASFALAPDSDLLLHLESGRVASISSISQGLAQFCDQLFRDDSSSGESAGSLK